MIPAYHYLPPCLRCIPCSHWRSAANVICDGTKRPTAFDSRTLTKTVTNCTDRQRSLSIICMGVKKFHICVFGGPFILYTDHQSLTSMIHPQKSIPVATEAGLQRYALFLAGYDYTTKYRKLKIHSYADGLSCLAPVKDARDGEAVYPAGVFNLVYFDPLPVTVENVRRETQINPVLAQVYGCPVKYGHTAMIPHLTIFCSQRCDPLQSCCVRWEIQL